jgi:hypothetical protein
VEVKVYVDSMKHDRKSYLELWSSLNWYLDIQSAVLHHTFPRCPYCVRLDLGLCQIFPLEMESAIWFGSTFCLYVGAYGIYRRAYIHLHWVQYFSPRTG